MSNLVSRNTLRAAMLAVATIAGTGGVLFALGADEASALCRYNTPHCIKKPVIPTPTVTTIRIPDSNWIDPDCAHYGNCH